MSWWRRVLKLLGIVLDATKQEPPAPVAHLAPMGTATVGPNAGPPSGYLWDRLTAARTTKELDYLDRYAEIQGYSMDGQLRKAIAVKRASL